MPVAHDANAAYSVLRSDAKATSPSSPPRGGHHGSPSVNYARAGKFRVHPTGTEQKATLNVMDQQATGRRTRSAADTRRQPPWPSTEGAGGPAGPGNGGAANGGPQGTRPVPVRPPGYDTGGYGPAGSGAQRALGHGTGPQRLSGSGGGVQPVLPPGTGAQPVLPSGSGAHRVLGPGTGRGGRSARAPGPIRSCHAAAAPRRRLAGRLRSREPDQQAPRGGRRSAVSHRYASRRSNSRAGQPRTRTRAVTPTWRTRWLRPMARTRAPCRDGGVAARPGAVSGPSGGSPRPS